jgi:hypothetical protein
MANTNLSGALGGAATGATLGSLFAPGIGTAVGALGGGLLGLFGGGNKQPKIQQQNLLHPLQEKALERYLSQGIETSPLYQQGSSFLQNLLSNNPEAYQAFELPYYQNFQQNIIPQLAERFAGMGTGAGGLSSSGLYNSLGQAGRNLQTDLAALRSGLQTQALPQALNYAQQPFSNLLASLGLRVFQPYERPGQPGLLTGLSSGILGGIGTGIGERGVQFFGNQLFGPSTSLINPGGV